MTERTKGRIRRGAQKTWSVASVGAILLLIQQAVAIRGELLKQDAAQLATAGHVATLTVDVLKLTKEVKALRKEVARLERPSRSWRSISGARHTGADSVTARSPGLGKIALDVVTAPFRLVKLAFGRR